MGRKPDLTAEEQQLKAATREAHEAIQELKDLIKQVKALTPDLVHDFEHRINTEIMKMSNHVTAEANRVSKQINDSLPEWRAQIVRLLSVSELVLDSAGHVTKLVMDTSSLDANVPMPYPSHIQPKEQS